MGKNDFLRGLKAAVSSIEHGSRRPKGRGIKPVAKHFPPTLCKQRVVLIELFSKVRMKGFVSVLFLLLVSETLILVGALENSSTEKFHPDGIPEALGLKRLELENGIDELIREELFLGLAEKIPREIIQAKINSRLEGHLAQWVSMQDGPIEYEMGFATLDQTNYLSLLRATLQPLNAGTFKANTHVLMLPIDGETWYGEYAYTGGLYGTSTLVVKMRTPGAETLFAIPSGHRTCASSILPTIPCAVEGAG